MFQGIGRLFGSGNGVVKYPHYATQGVPTRRGMRNRRSAAREQLKRAAQARARALEETAQEYGADNFEG